MVLLFAVSILSKHSIVLVGIEGKRSIQGIYFQSKFKCQFISRGNIFLWEKCNSWKQYLLISKNTPYLE